MHSYITIVFVTACILASVAPFEGAMAATIEPRVKSQTKPGPAKVHRENFKAQILAPLPTAPNKKYGFPRVHFG